MIDLSTGVFSCFGSHLSVFAMHRGAQNANRGKKVEKNTGRVLYDAGLTPGIYIRNFIHRRDYETNLFKLCIPGFENECPAYTCMPEKLDVYEADVELCYASATTLLVRTKRDLTLESHCLSGEQQAEETSFALYDEANHYGLYISPVSGNVSVSAEAGSVRVSLGAGSELRIEEGWDRIGTQKEIASFDECVAAQRASYEQFLCRLPQPLEGDEKLMELAAYGLWSAVGLCPRQLQARLYAGVQELHVRHVELGSLLCGDGDVLCFSGSGVGSADVHVRQPA